MTTAVRGARRAPVQRRSALRVERMLDAAAALLDEGGQESLTTSAIAAKAGVSVGSLYQFFPDKHAVAEALARRSFERFSQQLRAVRGETWQQTVDAVIDLYVDFSRTEPGFLVLSFGGPISQQLLDPEDDNNAVVARAIGAMVDLELPADVMRLAIEIGDAVLAVAFRRDRTGDPALIGEAKTAVKAYLAAPPPTDVSPVNGCSGVFLALKTPPLHPFTGGSGQSRRAKASFQTGS